MEVDTQKAGKWGDRGSLPFWSPWGHMQVYGGVRLGLRDLSVGSADVQRLDAFSKKDESEVTV